MSSAIKTPFVKTETKNFIGKITFYHPKGNSLPLSLMNEIVEAIRSLSDNDEVKIILLQSEGDSIFCAGASFDELVSIDNFEDASKFFMGFASVINALKTSSKLVVTIVKGKVVGGGTGIVAASDYVIADLNAKVKLSELSINIGPFVIENAITRKIGISNFSSLCLAPLKWKSPKWALEKGLYNAIYEDDFDEKVDEYLKVLQKTNLKALSAAKKMLWENTNDWLPEMEKRAKVSAELVLLPEAQNVIKSFLK